MIPLLGTSAGGACVFFMKRGLDINIQKALTGFAAGVMVAASVWSLIIPAMEQSSDLGQLAFIPAFIGFWLGVLFLLILDNIIPHLHLNAENNEGPVSHLTRTTMMVLAVVLHNIPEGMLWSRIRGIYFRLCGYHRRRSSCFIYRYCYTEFS